MRSLHQLPGLHGLTAEQCEWCDGTENIDDQQVNHEPSIRSHPLPHLIPHPHLFQNNERQNGISTEGEAPHH